VSFRIFPGIFPARREFDLKLTAKGLAKHKPPSKTDCIVFDDDIAGFGLRTRNGRYSWIFQYTIGSGAGRITRRIKIGDYPALPPARAREEAQGLHAKVHLHGDPAIERRKNRLEAGKTFGKLVTQYLEFKQDQMRPRSFAEVKRHLEVHAEPLHALPLAAVDQGVVAQRLNAVAKAGAVAANRTRASLSALFVWAMGEGLATANPVISTNRREEKARERVLTDTELQTIWQCAGDDDYGIIVKLLILTGQRRNEIAGLCWSELDFDRDIIELPADRTKNGRSHSVHMARQVRSLLKPRERTEERDFVFGYRDGSFSGWSKSKVALDERVKRSTGSELKHWTLHDLRRTTATGMAGIGIQPHVIEAVLNHVSGHKGGIAGIYNRAQYSAEKAQALARWDEHIAALLRGRRSNVSALRREGVK
jgi:integrase